MNAPSYVTVTELARDRGVSPQRIRHLIDSGEIPALQVGSGHLIDADTVVPRSTRSRPLSDRMAWALIDALSDIPTEGLAPIERLRTTRRIAALRAAPIPEQVLREWTRSVATTHHLAVPAADLAALREDPDFLASGFSDARSTMPESDRLEGYLSDLAAAPLLERYPAVRADRAGLVLHTISAEQRGRLSSPAPFGLILIDLARDASETSSTAVRALLAPSA